MFGWKKKFLPCLLVLCTLVLTASCGNQKQEETAWKPEGQWSYTPMLSNVNPEDYDIELTLDSTTYSQNTEKIVCTIINKTGLTFQVYGIPMIEKCFIGNQWARLPYEIKERRAGDIATCYCDASKAKEELGWIAEKGIEEMCADSWRWQSNNPNGYEDQ